MKCEFCGGLVSWVGSLVDNPSTKCAGCGRTNCQEVEPARFDDEWAPNPNDDQGAPGVAVRCPLCGYQHGHAIGCANNPVDIALAAGVAPCQASIYEQRLRAVLEVVNNYLPPHGVSAETAMTQIIDLVDPWPVGATVVPPTGDTPFPMNVYLRNVEELEAFVRKHISGVAGTLKESGNG